MLRLQKHVASWYDIVLQCESVTWLIVLPVRKCIYERKANSLSLSRTRCIFTALYQLQRAPVYGESLINRENMFVFFSALLSHEKRFAPHENVRVFRDYRGRENPNPPEWVPSVRL